MFVENIKKVEGLLEKNAAIREDLLSRKAARNPYSKKTMDYLQYVEDVYGSNGSILTAAERLLQGVSLEYQMRANEIGVISHIRPAEALTGIITTNPNYREGSRIVNLAKAVFKQDYDPIRSYGMSDTDTRLGIISNSLYSRALEFGASFNTNRGRGVLNNQYRYITPSLYGQYGNNSSNFTRLSDILWIDTKTGRTRDNIGGDAKILSYTQAQKDLNLNTDFLEKQMYEGIRIYEDERSQAFMDNKGDIFFKDIYTPNEGDDYVSKFDGRWTVNATVGQTNQTGNKKREHLIYNEKSIDSDEVLKESNKYSFDAFQVSWGGGNSLLDKTKKMFENNTIKTMIARFHDDPIGDDFPSNSSAYDPSFGFGHGRTLLKENPNGVYDNGYENPYCRSWTYHHQYHAYKDAIRPFIKEDGKPYKINEIQGEVSEFRSHVEGTSVTKGGQYLHDYTVLGDNGFVKIAPYQDEGSKIKHKYMLSIENLAWKDFPLAIESARRGPNGGRIMWFPPYDVDFQENVSVDWAQNTFIGRGEKVYTYANTDRTAQLSFTLLIDHPSIFDKDSARNASGARNDDNILRHFAGCSIFKADNSNNNDKNVEPEKNMEPQGIPSEVDGSGGEKITFCVFFPNNYSGHVSGNTIDDDWVEYLLYGEDVLSVGTNNRGYEIGNNGITTTNSGANRYIQAVNTTDEDHRFRYRVDYDLKQSGLTVNSSYTSYKDTVSFRFNSTLSSVTNNTNNNFTDIVNCTFAEFIVAATYTGYDQYLTSCGVSTVRIDDIRSKLSMKTIKSVTVKGGATQQDSKNSNKLANRRAKTVANGLKEWLRTYYTGEIALDAPFTFTDNLEKDKSVITNTAKYQRCAKVEIVYGASETTYKDEIGPEVVETEEYQKTESNTNVVQTQSNYMRDDSGRTLKGYEYEYFKQLDVTNPLIFKKITDKFKYFDPAFHSMSPEGFNARLNFLHQCTRQGHTISASEVNAGSWNTAPTAGNLAFGRMPVCVLKIGDFINTRMIVQSLSIQYSENGIQWDLNPEGIGVQPVFAKVSMGVILIGGSALNGPINRLQNAQTFDYYANTGVYDPRADRIIYKNDEDDNVKGEKVTYEYLYTPSRPKDNTSKAKNK